MTAPTFTPEKAAQAVKEMALLYSAIAEGAGDIARARRALFLAYVSEGFSEAQALELCKVMAS